RLKYLCPRTWKVPPNLYIGRLYITVGLGSVFMMLLSIAIVNLFPKSVATVSGTIFSAVFFVISVVSEKINLRKFHNTAQQMKDQFQLLQSDTVDRESVGLRPGSVLVSVRDYNALHHLRWV